MIADRKWHRSKDNIIIYTISVLGFQLPTLVRLPLRSSLRICWIPSWHGTYIWWSHIWVVKRSSVLMKLSIILSTLVWVRQCRISWMDLHELASRGFLLIHCHNIRVAPSCQLSIRGLYFVATRTHWNPQHII